MTPEPWTPFEDDGSGDGDSGGAFDEGGGLPDLGDGSSESGDDPWATTGIELFADDELELKAKPDVMKNPILLDVLVEYNGASQLLVTVREVNAQGQVLRIHSRQIFEASVNGPTQAEITRAAEGGRAQAQRIAARQNRVCSTRLRFGANFAIALIVGLVYNGYISAGEASAQNIISTWESFYGSCNVLYDWMNHANTQGPTNSCTACYDYYFGGTHQPPGSGALTICDEQLPTATYQDLVNVLGPQLRRRAQYCAAFPGGYFSQPHNGILPMPDAPNKPDRSQICPY